MDPQNYIAHTPSSGDNSNRIATTAFVQQVAGGITPPSSSLLPTPSAPGDTAYWNGSAWVIFAGNSSGTKVFQESSAGVPSWGTISATGALVSVNAYSSSQTITIPSGATKAVADLWGGTGGSGGVSLGGQGASGGTGAAGFVRKYLTGLTAGNTLTWTQGAAGAAGSSAPGAGGNGTASTLASGTQVISTLTANGSNGSGSASATASSGTAGGTATGGDVNLTGETATNGVQMSTTDNLWLGGVAGATMFSYGAHGTNTPGGAGRAGQAGGLLVGWFS
jgi:hypothetical protein